MVKNTYSHIRIAGMAAAVSSHWQSIEECAADPRAPGDFHAAKFTKSTGVKGRYLCLKNQTPADFCVAAAENLLTEKKIARNEIGGGGLCHTVSGLPQSCDCLRDAASTGTVAGLCCA